MGPAGATSTLAEATPAELFQPHASERSHQPERQPAPETTSLPAVMDACSDNPTPDGRSIVMPAHGPQSIEFPTRIRAIGQHQMRNISAVSADLGPVSTSISLPAPKAPRDQPPSV